ncbi:MAG: glycosyltransferase family 9 protein [Alphaproteobacteria bacterium]
MEKILVIKLGALGDFIQAIGAFASIRKQHPKAEITLLTTPPFVDLAQKTGFFDAVWVDKREKFYTFDWLKLRQKIKRFAPEMVYDLQTASRSNFYYKILGPGKRPNWSGIAKGCSHFQAHPDRKTMENLSRLKNQLAVAGIDDFLPINLTFLGKEAQAFQIKEPYVLLVLGASKGKDFKRWPLESFILLAQKILERGHMPVFIGGGAEKTLIPEIEKHVPEALNLVGKTSLDDLAALGRGAEGFVGNDTGPSHLLAYTGCKTVILFSETSLPDKSAPRGKHVTVLRRGNLSELPVDEVLLSLYS